MSSVILSSEVYPGRARSSRGQVSSRKIERIFTGFIILLLGIIIVELGFHFWIAPSVLIDRIVISADSNFIYSDDFLLEKAGVKPSDTFFDIKTEIIEKRLLLIPAIQSVSVKKVFPSILKIDIESRVPVGLSLISTDAGVVPAMIDSEGVVFMTGYNMISMDFPVISGLDFPEIRDGMRMPKELCSFLEDMEGIKRLSPDLYGMISEIKFVRTGSADYEVLLYPKNYKTKIRIGSGIDEKLLKYIIMVLEVISGQPGMEKLEEIDFRTGDIVYRIQGA
ncbi:MAG: FtsQ-type POTRA domain-containing protein [Spirochaetota bacterium]|nr:FtsQ-type POTRA domain-containing protein [Spirochaetota bacterium]